ncbi:MAG: cell filamentation protein Fic [Gammaproteobacteria bacterium]|nr:MAG: cell filamentation protein Fic [Gammaproteobacteria bacterium]
MPRIRTPKSKQQLLGEIDAQAWLALMPHYKATDANGLYLPWDKFQWRVPNGTSAEAAWLATKMSRAAMLTGLPLNAERGECFSYCTPSSLNAMLHKIDKISGGGHKIGDDAFATTREKDKYLVKSLMMEEAITSSQMEGASTTRKVAKEMLETERPPKDQSEKMIVNNFLLMKEALATKDQPLSIDLMLTFHAIATRDAIENEAISGELRRDNNIKISDYYDETAHIPPDYTTLIDRLQQLCEFANTAHDKLDSHTFIHPLVKAIILHFMIGFIHPFGDGNGRTARALFYWYMLKSGYWLFEYVSISKLIQEKRSEYDTAFIHSETDEFDLTYFIYHQTDVVLRSLKALQCYIAEKKSAFYQFMEWVSKSPKSKGLKQGQLEILKSAMKEPGKTFTAKTVASDLGVNENTARKYLNELVERELLLSAKKPTGKTVVYIAPSGLQQLLSVG